MRITVANGKTLEQCVVSPGDPPSPLGIHEFGFEKLERKEVPDALSLLYKVIDGRNRRSSTAVITNVSFDDWTEYLGDPPMTMALLDRVVDRTKPITFEGESFRGDALRKLKRTSGK